MRNLATVALLLIGSLAVARAAAPNPGKVTKVNQGAHTFTVQWIATSTHHHFTAGHNTGSIEKTYKTSDKTTYLVGSAPGSWANVTKGAQVNILAAHSEGSDRVADKVQIVTGS